MMSDAVLCRQRAREAMRAVSREMDPELATYYRDLAAAYLSLARRLEQSAGRDFGKPDFRARPSARMH